MNKISYLHLVILLIQLSLTISCTECHNPDDIDSIFERLYIQEEGSDYNPLDTQKQRNKNRLLQYFNDAKKRDKKAAIDIAMVKHLIEEEDANLIEQDNYGRNIIHAALDMQCSFELIKYLVEQLEAKHPNKVKTILNKIEKDRETKERKTPFLYATYCFDVNILQFLVAHGAKPTEIELQIALLKVVETNNIANLEIFEYLSSLNDKIATAIAPSLLNKILQAKNYTFLEPILMKQGKNFHINKQDEAGNTILHNLALNGDEKNTRVLIDKYHPNINSRNKKGKTPLMLAIKKNHAPAVITLLREGVDPTLADSKGKTPLELANRKLEKQQEQNKGVSDNPAQQAIVDTLTKKLRAYNTSSR